MPGNMLLATVYLLIAYWGVTIAGIGLTIMLSKALGVPGAREAGVPPYESPA